MTTRGKIALGALGTLILLAAAWFVLGITTSRSDSGGGGPKVTVKPAPKAYHVQGDPGAVTTVTQSEGSSDTTTGTVVNSDPGAAPAGPGCVGGGCGNLLIHNDGTYATNYGTCRTVCYLGMHYYCDKRHHVTTWSGIAGDIYKAEWWQRGCWSPDAGSAVCCTKPMTGKCWTTGLGDASGWSCEDGPQDANGSYSPRYHLHLAWVREDFHRCLPEPLGCFSIGTTLARGNWAINSPPTPPKHFEFWLN